VKPKNRLIATVLVALWSAIAHPLARAMDSCAAMIAALCSIEPPPPTDNLEPHPELAIVERASAEQAPPPAAAPPPGGRGMTYTMEDPFPYYRPNTSTVFNQLRNGAAALLRSG
jgi:hypothetical protein